MRIRWKLLILTLSIALVPLLTVTCIDRLALRHLGTQFGTVAREELTDAAGRRLLRVAEDYGEAIRRDKATLEMALRLQAQAIRRCLAQTPPSSAPPVWWAEDYDRGEDLPPGMIESDRHLRYGPDGRYEPIQITREEQVFVRAPGVTRAQVADDVARLAMMPPEWKLLNQGHPRLIHSHYVALENGLHVSYPGRGGYPAGFDPRRRKWYRRAVQQNELTWTTATVDASTNEVVVTLAIPVRNAQRDVVGVTAIDLRLAELLRGATVQSAWSNNARALLVYPWGDPDTGRSGGLIVAQPDYLRRHQRWDEPIELEWLTADNATQLQEVLTDMQAGRSKFREIADAGQIFLWAYSPAGPKQAAILLIVPQADVTAYASKAEQDIMDGTRTLLLASAVTTLIVMVVVLFVAFRSSLAVTRPVAQLVEAAQRIAGGDLGARTQIKTKDEMGTLGEAFNGMLPKLRDRMRLRDSLALAMHVQQRLLPSESPKISGLDVAGRSLYCDETGGDYFDFLPSSDSDPTRLAVVIGDVTGHGIAAALLMATGRALLRSRVHGPGGLAQIVTDMNRMLTADTDDDRFMTLVLLLIDVSARRLSWVSAGHDPPLVYHPDEDRFTELEGGGVPLGIEADWQYKEDGCDALPGTQVIVLGTDGIWEAHNSAGEMFGKDRLREVIRKHAARTADQICTPITTTVADFRQEHPQEDDLTLIVVKFLPRR